MKLSIKRTDFYTELSKDKQKEYLGFKEAKFLPAIDNIYYSLFIRDDTKENLMIGPFLAHLETLKKQYLSSHQPQEFGLGLVLDNKTYKLYKYCLSQPDLYDIFILSYLPNTDTPRILIQVRAYGLWTYGIDKMLTDSFNTVKTIFESLGCTIDKCRESRVDYCYHTNIISNPEKIFSDRNIGNQMHTTMKRWHQTGRIEFKDGKTILCKDYFALGERGSNNVFIRCYNKALEVIDNGYKGFFFELWHQKGLISFYDKYCFEYALTHKDYDYVHKAKLMFYLEYGTDARVKREFELTILDANNTAKDFEYLAKSYMPEVTTVINVEFETKRKFYYYSDNFIDTMLKHQLRDNLPVQLYRIYRIIDNRAVFLDYLTSTSLCFVRKREESYEDGEKVVAITYASWWERLRNTKLDGFKVDQKLIREYSNKLDERIVKVKLINNVASNAVYSDNIDSGFIEDISDMLSNLNDNHAHELKLSVDGEVHSSLLIDYKTKKFVKEKRLRNRKRKDKKSDE